MDSLPLQKREATLIPSTEERTFNLAVSSEMPVDRFWGREVLSHDPGALVMDRAGDARGIALLMNHDPENLIGRAHDFSIGVDHVLRARVVLASTEDALEAWQLIQDGALVDVSVGYRIHEIKTLNPGKDNETQLVTRWEPYEVSLVSVPADPSVGIGRGADATYPVLRMVAEAELPNPPGSLPGTTTEVRMPDITPEVAAQQAVPTENSRKADLEAAFQLRAIADKFGFGQKAEEILQARGIDEARRELMTLLADRTPVQAPVVDMSKKEAREYSYARAIMGGLDRAEGKSTVRSFEDEVSESIQRSMPASYKQQGGIFVPMQLRTAGSQMDSITSTAGTEMKFTEAGELIELLRNYAAVIRRGARVMTGLVGPVTFPKLTADATVGWVAENPGSDLSATAPTFSTVTLSAKTMSGATPYSRQLLAQTNYAIEAIVREGLAAGHALALDKAALHGTGSSNQPTGIYKTTGINTKAMGGAPTFAKLQDMITEVAVDNALMGALGWLTTPGMAGKLAQTLAESSAGSDHIWTGPYENGFINGYGAIATNQCSAVMSVLEATGASSHALIFGNWADLLIGTWGAMELVVDPYTYKKQALIEVASFQMADIQLRHPASFCCATGATI